MEGGCIEEGERERETETETERAIIQTPAV